MDYKNAGVDIEAGYESSGTDEGVRKEDNERRSSRRSGWFLRCIFPGKDQEHGGTGSVIRYRRMRNESKAGISSWINTIPSALMLWQCV